jgi:Xaa-Pro aminopeptidase
LYQGRFTPAQRVIYETVLEMQREAMRAMRPGVTYLDLQALVYRIMLRRLRDDLKILRGDVEEMMSCDLGAVFMWVVCVYLSGGWVGVD